MRTKSFILTLVFALYLSVSVFAQKTTPDISVDIEGKPVVVLKSVDIAKLPRVEVKSKDHDGVESTYSGFELRSILEPLGAKFGKELRGSMIAQFLVITGADGYHAVYSLTELDPNFTDKVVIIADKINGNPLSTKHGPWQIIATNEKKHARLVRQVVALKVRLAK